jgi:hypothetical protein
MRQAEAEVTNHERMGLNALGLPEEMRHGAVVGHMKRWKQKTFYKGKLD